MIFIFPISLNIFSLSMKLGYSFLCLELRKELDRCLDAAGHRFEWADIKLDLKSLQMVTLEENNKQLHQYEPSTKVSAAKYSKQSELLCPDHPGIMIEARNIKR
jgi:hypothetical protein